jgi:hypothetical protein
MKNKKEDGTEEVSVKLDDDTQKKLDSALSLKDDFSKVTEMLTGLKDIQAFVAESKREKEAAAAESARKARETQSQQTDEELQQLILTDPGRAIKEGTKDQSMAILMLRADQLKRDVFEDQDKFSYYTGDIKCEIDKLLAGQNLQLRNDPSVIENCYWTVLGKHSEEIREGKLKSRFAGSGGSRGTASGSAGAGKDDAHEHLEINDDMRHAARIAGMKPEDYAKMCYDQGVGYV